MGAPSGIQRNLEEPVQHWVKGPRSVAQGIRLADLVENLVLAQNCALQTTGDADEVARSGGVLESKPSCRQLGKFVVAERACGYVQFDSVAGVHQDDRLPVRQCLTLRCKGLAGSTGHPPGHERRVPAR